MSNELSIVLKLQCFPCLSSLTFLFRSRILPYLPPYLLPSFPIPSSLHSTREDLFLLLVGRPPWARERTGGLALHASGSEREREREDSERGRWRKTDGAMFWANTHMCVSVCVSKAWLQCHGYTGLEVGWQILADQNTACYSMLICVVACQSSETLLMCMWERKTERERKRDG